MERVKKIFNLQSSIFNNKIKKYNFADGLLLWWLLLIPTQLGKHFWLKESSIMGARIDYLSIILYLTDIVWFLWVLKKSSIFNLQSSIIKKIKFQNIITFQNFILLLFVGVNIIFAQARWVALYRWLRIGQWFLTWKIIRNEKLETRNEKKRDLGWIVPIWIILEAFLGLAQVVKGGSLNGIWWWLGERRFSFGGIGIAQMRLFDEGWIRAYGTFSHPNSLAGFLLLAWWFWRKKSLIFSLQSSIKKILYWVVNWSAVLGIILTGSRVVWMLTIAMLVGEQFSTFNLQSSIKNKKIKKQLIGKGLLFLGVICLSLGVININYKISDFVGGWDVNSWNKREMLGLSAIKMVEKYPLFGVGAGNFIVNLPKFRVGNFYWMQPVHNIFLLIWSEIGVLGIIILIFSFQSSDFNLSTIGGSTFGGQSLIFKILKKKNWWFLVIVGVTGMLDHYWLTLPQNTWLLAVILGLI